MVMVFLAFKNWPTIHSVCMPLAFYLIEVTRVLWRLAGGCKEVLKKVLQSGSSGIFHFWQKGELFYIQYSCTFQRKWYPFHVPTVEKPHLFLVGLFKIIILKAILNTLNDTEFFLLFSTLQLVKSLSIYNVYTSSLKKVPLLGAVSSYSPLWGLA